MSDTQTIASQLSDQYRTEGYFILPDALPESTLAGLREDCGNFIAAMDARMDSLGVDTLGINHRDDRYFIALRNHESEFLPEFLASDLMAEICRATIGEDAWLFVEQFVVKFPRVGRKLSWHQDSGYVGHPHRPYVTIWIPLEDSTVENGTIWVLPNSRSGVKGIADHVLDEGSNDLVGYQGDDPGEPIILKAGSLAVFSSLTLHRSGTNTTDQMRRAYIVQYSPEPIMNSSGEEPWGLAVPILKDGVPHEGPEPHPRPDPDSWCPN